MNIKDALFNSYNCPKCGQPMVKHLDRLYHCSNCKGVYGLNKKWATIKLIVTILAYLFEAFLITYLRDVLQVHIIVNVLIVFGLLIPILMFLKSITISHLEPRDGVKNIYYDGH